MELLIALFAGVMGAAMAGIWARDIASGVGYDASEGLLKSREIDTEDLMMWHWLAEFGTAGLLMLGAILLVVDAAVAEPVMLLGLGALAYTSSNSLGWSLARPDRRSYAYPMAIGLIGAIISAAILILDF
jgi:hypothetical protein